MKLEFPRYIYGMLQTPDKKSVYGDWQPVAYSKGFSEDLQREVFKKVRPELSGDMLREFGNAYGFFPLFDDGFVAAHYQLMDLMEPTPRGQPVFSEYFYITALQLKAMNWNLFPIFGSFLNIGYFGKIVKDIPPAVIEFEDNERWMDNLRRFPVQVEALLVRYLSSSQKINIITSTDNYEARLGLLCALIQCVPSRYRGGLSFATLAKDTSETVRVFFSSTKSGTGQVMEWSAPTIPNLSGFVYADWVASLIRESTPEEFRRKITNLKLPWNTNHLKNLGAELDLAKRYHDWSANREGHLRIRAIEQLRVLAQHINEFSCIFTPQEAEEWLSFLLSYVLRWTAYDIGIESLSHYMSLITEDKSRQMIVQKIVNEIFLYQKGENLPTLAGFIVHTTEHGIRTNQNMLLDFSKEILIACLSSEDCENSLKLWGMLKSLTWAHSATWFSAGIDAIPQARTKENFIFIVNNIGCPADRSVFDSLLRLIKRSPNLIHQVPENTRFLETTQFGDGQEYLDRVAKCFLETRSNEWLVTQIQFGCETLPEIQVNFPRLIANIGISGADDLLNYVLESHHGLLTVLISYSIMLIRIQQSNNDSPAIDKYMSISKDCKSENISAGIVILQNHWDYFSIEKLELMLNILEKKQPKHQTIEFNLRKIRDTIQRKIRVREIQNVFSKRITKGDLGYIVYDFVNEFCRSTDITAWKLFEAQIRSRNYVTEYRGYLIQILLENRFFHLTDTQLYKISMLLNEANLNYEADIFIHWLFFRRGLFVNPIPTIRSTIKLEGIHPVDAGFIISYKGAVDKKQLRTLVTELVRMDPTTTRIMLEELDQYVSNHPISSFETMLKALVSDINPGVIWTENCKLLSRYIKSELGKGQNWRK